MSNVIDVQDVEVLKGQFVPLYMVEIPLQFANRTSSNQLTMISQNYPLYYWLEKNLVGEMYVDSHNRKRLFFTEQKIALNITYFMENEFQPMTGIALSHGQMSRDLYESDAPFVINGRVKLSVNENNGYDLYKWFLENTRHKVYFYSVSDMFLFQDKDEALAFKLRWYNENTQED